MAWRRLFSADRWVGVRLRVVEKTLLAFFAALLIASLTLSLPGATLAVLVALNVMVGCLIATLSRDDLAERIQRIASPIRDWLPAPLMLLAYRESGLFAKPDPAHRLDHLFILWDQMLFRSRWVHWLLNFCAPWLQHYLELCYLLCYPLVPLGFAALYFERPSITAQREPGRAPKNLPFRGAAGDEEPRKSSVPRARFFPFRPLRDSTKVSTDASRHPAGISRVGRNLYHKSYDVEVMFDKFWTAVLLATLFCYAIYPLFPLAPPRILFSDVPGPPVPPLLRNINLWVLARFSVQACLFPSGHAAAVTATALAVREYRPRLGILFCLVAASVAAATVYGRYHYAADAVAGVLVGVVAFVVSRRMHKL